MTQKEHGSRKIAGKEKEKLLIEKNFFYCLTAIFCNKLLFLSLLPFFLINTDAWTTASAHKASFGSSTTLFLRGVLAEQVSPKYCLFFLVKNVSFLRKQTDHTETAQKEQIYFLVKLRQPSSLWKAIQGSKLDQWTVSTISLLCIFWTKYYIQWHL